MIEEHEPRGMPKQNISTPSSKSACVADKILWQHVAVSAAPQQAPGNNTEGQTFQNTHSLKATKGGGQDGMMQTVLCGDWLEEGERERHRKRQEKRQFDMFQCDEVSKL